MGWRAGYGKRGCTVMLCGGLGEAFSRARDDTVMLCERGGGQSTESCVESGLCKER